MSKDIRLPLPGTCGQLRPAVSSRLPDIAATLETDIPMAVAPVLQFSCGDCDEKMDIYGHPTRPCYRAMPRLAADKEAAAAEQRGWRRVDLDAFHFAMLSAPALLTDALAELCR